MIVKVCLKQSVPSQLHITETVRNVIRVKEYQPKVTVKIKPYERQYSVE